MLLVSGFILGLVSGGTLILISGGALRLVDGLVSGHICGLIVSSAMDAGTTTTTALVKERLIERRYQQEDQPKGQKVGANHS